MKWNTLTGAERAEISILKTKGYSLRAIAQSLGRSPNTISYELRKNTTRGTYESKKAGAKSRLRKRMRRFQWRKLNRSHTLQKAVVLGLEGHWNPDEIAGRMKQERQSITISKNSIYRWLYSDRGQRYCHLLYSKRYKRKPRRGSKKRVLIPNRIDISRRFLGSENRTRYGHWEKDSVVSGKGISASLATAQERKSRLVSARKVRNMSPVDHEIATHMMLQGKKAISITRDNGIENIYHEQNPTPSFFCRPYASWQKGGIENANKLLRAFFPKGTDFRKVTQEEVDHAVSFINNKPRKILGYKTALEVASAVGIINSITS